MTSGFPPSNQGAERGGDPSPPMGSSFAHPSPNPADRQRPWWGMGDIALGFIFFFVVATVGGLLGLFFGSLDDLVSIAGSSATATDLPISLVAVSLVAQQVGQGVWPFIVSKWKGLGAVADWRLRFTLADLGIGIGVAMIGLAGATLANQVMGALIDLTDEASADNTQILRDAEGSPWMIIMLFGVIVGAPVTEELFFRGLTLRAIEKRWGSVTAVILSSVIFTLPHFTGSDWKGTLTLFASIFVVGLVLGAAAIITDRIASSIVAHMVFNTIGAAAALGWFDGFAV